VNKDQHIATLVAKDAELIGELYIAYGHGYMIGYDVHEELKRTGSRLVEKPDVIFVDAIFSPIEKVNFFVEDFLIRRSLPLRSGRTGPANLPRPSSRPLT